MEFCQCCEKYVDLEDIIETEDEYIVCLDCAEQLMCVYCKEIHFHHNHHILREHLKRND